MLVRECGGRREMQRLTAEERNSRCSFVKGLCFLVLGGSEACARGDGVVEIGRRE